MTKRITKAERESAARTARDGLKADLRGAARVVTGDRTVPRVYVLRTSTPRTLRLFYVECPEGAVASWCARLRECTVDVSKAPGLRLGRNGVSIPGGNSNPCHDTVMDLASVLFGDARALRCEEI